ncbi:heme-binding protein [Kineosporia succinea]|uniref:Uncharacterized protein n=1 Tax=Kineosporia succinea TaxID=84632 RepID=A0ABT9PB05_9ACTN|nr:heme-binding protein [Kineosporia succinea]MDP9829848.1 hypothetical protein [Kineosporia succinea]
MELAPDFVMRPLSNVEDDDEGGKGFSAAAVKEAKPAAGILGRLAGLEGKWSGTGFNVIWRPNHRPVEQDRFLQLNVTTETMEFQRIAGDIPNRGLLQPDINMAGLHYLQQITDKNLGAGLHFEPGIWAHVPVTSNPKEPVTLVRMATIPHGTSILAQGMSTTQDETVGPSIPKVSIKPFSIGSPKDTIDFEEQDLATKTKFRTPAAGLVGVTQAMVNDPNSVLRAAIAKQKITSTTRLQVTTARKPVVGGGSVNTAFLVGTADGPNAVAAKVTSTFWLEKIDGEKRASQLQYTQTVLLDFAGLSWPHISVATLRRVA